MTPPITFIVTARNRPRHLKACLATLLLQEGDPDIQVAVSSEAGEINYHYIDDAAGDINCIYCSDPDHEQGYHWGCCPVVNEWVCFPTEDILYAPDFARIMMKYAIKNDWDFVHCDLVYDPRYAYATRGVEDEYSVMSSRMSLGGIDKCNFIIKTKVMEELGGFPPHPSHWRDGALAEAVINARYKHGKAPGVLLIKS